jgi:hypothetical protein
VSLKLSWSPIPRFDLVGEFLTGRRVDKDGQRRTPPSSSSAAGSSSDRVCAGVRLLSLWPFEREL